MARIGGLCPGIGIGTVWRLCEYAFPLKVAQGRAAPQVPSRTNLRCNPQSAWRSRRLHSTGEEILKVLAEEATELRHAGWGRGNRCPRRRFGRR